MSPQRIQRRRTAGWRMPHGAKYVGRPTRWGNPFRVGDRYVSRTWCNDAPYPAPDAPLGTREHPAAFGWPAWIEVVDVVRDRAHAVDLFRAHITFEDLAWDPAEIRRDLGGRDLACWCPESEPCHADVLLTIASGKESSR